MGYEAACRLTTGRRTLQGTARLEQKELVFRGDERMTIPLTSIQKAVAEGESLILTVDGRRTVLELGASAARWADRIANPPSRLAKLGIKQGTRVALLNFDDEDHREDRFVEELESANAAIVGDARDRDLDAIFFVARSARDLAKLRSLSGRIKPAGAVWVVRAKGREAAVTEAESMAAGKAAGLVDVKVVSFSDRYSAEKYVIPIARREPAGRSGSPSPRTRGPAPSRGRT
jgi:hypothetical protein